MSLVSLVLVPVRHYLSAFILEDTPMKVFAYLVMSFHILGAAEHAASAGNVGVGFIVFATQASKRIHCLL
eukprot:1705375-Ditylum_brightwellii.AAC.1